MRKRDIVAAIREDISSGAFNPGDSLPLRTDMEKRFNSSVVTVQRAMEELARDGWITSHGRSGTRVALNPPFLRHYGLFFGTKPDPQKPSRRFWSVIENACKEVFNLNDSKLSVYCGLNINGSIIEYQKFDDTLKQQRLAGMIFASWPSLQIQNFLATQPNLPCAIFHQSPPKGMMALKIQSHLFFGMACEIFQKRGRRRMAALQPDVYFDISTSQDFLSQLERFGMDQRLEWLQPSASFLYENALAAQLRLLFCSSGNDRPDCLYLGDDNLIDPVCKIIKDMGLNIPKDLEIVAWGGLPWDEIYEVPVHRIGLNLKSLLMSAKEGIDLARRGGSLPKEATCSDTIIHIAN